ncbi:hypothetical protein ACQY0O_005467 [Thecaphora frezii]
MSEMAMSGGSRAASIASSEQGDAGDDLNLPTTSWHPQQVPASDEATSRSTSSSSKILLKPHLRYKGSVSGIADEPLSDDYQRFLEETAAKEANASRSHHRKTSTAKSSPRRSASMLDKRSASSAHRAQSDEAQCLYSRHFPGHLCAQSDRRISPWLDAAYHASDAGHRLYRWEESHTTAVVAMAYSVLWYTDLLPTAFFLMLIYYILRFKYFPPSESYLHDKEKAKNLILWRNPTASQRSVALLSLITLFVAFAPAHYVWKAFFFFIGVNFFCLMPLQSHFPTHRKALSPVWWILFGAPTDAQFTIQLLRHHRLELGDAVERKTASADVGKTSKHAKPPLWLDKREAGIPPGLHSGARRQRLRRNHLDHQSEAAQARKLLLPVQLWSSLGMKIARANGQPPLLFANVQNHDEAFNLILAVCSNR